MSQQLLAQVDVGPEHATPGEVLDLGTTGTELVVPGENTGTGAGDHGGEALFPAFDSTAFASHLFWLLISFGILLFVVNRLIVPRVGGIIDDRRDRLANDLGEASRLSRETDEVVAAYEAELLQARQKAYAIAQERRGELKAEQARRQAETEAELAEKIAAAEGDIAGRRDLALRDVAAIAAEAASAIVEKVAGLRVKVEESAEAVGRSEVARAAN